MRIFCAFDLHHPELGPVIESAEELEEALRRHGRLEAEVACDFTFTDATLERAAMAALVPLVVLRGILPPTLTRAGRRVLCAPGVRVCVRPLLCCAEVSVRADGMKPYSVAFYPSEEDDPHVIEVVVVRGRAGFRLRRWSSLPASVRKALERALVLPTA